MEEFTGGAFKCRFCKKTFNAKSILKRHLLGHAPIKPFKCQVCSTGFFHKSSFTRHTLKKSCSSLDLPTIAFSHRHLKSINKKRYQCPLCGLLFTLSSTLRRHLKRNVCTLKRPDKKSTAESIEQQILPTIEPQMENLSSANSLVDDANLLGNDDDSLGKLQNLVSSVNDEYAFEDGPSPPKTLEVCALCRETFESKADLRIHMKKHMESKPSETSSVKKKQENLSKPKIAKYFCDVCGRGSPSSRGLTIHKLKCPNTQQHKCLICGKCFGHRYLLNRHLKRHKDILSKSKIHPDSVKSSNNSATDVETSLDDYGETTVYIREEMMDEEDFSYGSDGEDTNIDLAQVSEDPLLENSIEMPVDNTGIEENKGLDNEDIDALDNSNLVQNVNLGAHFIAGLLVSQDMSLLLPNAMAVEGIQDANDGFSLPDSSAYHQNCLSQSTDVAQTTEKIDDLDLSSITDHINIPDDSCNLESQIRYNEGTPITSDIMEENQGRCGIIVHEAPLQCAETVERARVTSKDTNEKARMRCDEIGSEAPIRYKDRKSPLECDRLEATQTRGLGAEEECLTSASSEVSHIKTREITTVYIEENSDDEISFLESVQRDPEERMGGTFDPLMREAAAAGNSKSGFLVTCKEEVSSQDGSECSTDQKHACNLCGLAFDQKSSLRKHMSEHGEKRKFKCSVCWGDFLFESDLAKHMESHQLKEEGSNMYECRKNMYECNICHVKIKKKCGLSTHLRTHSSIRPFACSECDMTFATKTPLVRHMKTHMIIQIENGFPTDTGELTPSDLVEAKLDPEAATLTDPVAMTLVEPAAMIAADPAAMAQAEPVAVTPPESVAMMLAESREVPSYDESDQKLAAELLVDSGSVTPQDPTSCYLKHYKVVFDNLIVDSSQETVITRKYKCNICGEMLEEKKGLKLHSKEHGVDLIGNRTIPKGNYPCRICKRSFARRCSLTMHSRVHRGYRPYRCPLCNMTLPTKMSLRVHMYSHKRQGYGKLHALRGTSQAPIVNTSDSSAAVQQEHGLGLEGNLNEDESKEGIQTSDQDRDRGDIFHFDVERSKEDVKNFVKNPDIEEMIGLANFDEERIKDTANADTEEGKGDEYITEKKVKKTFKCKDCGRMFDRKSSFVLHRNVHLGNRPYPCTVCPARFLSYPSLQLHMYKHRPSFQQPLEVVRDEKVSGVIHGGSAAPEPQLGNFVANADNAVSKVRQSEPPKSFKREHQCRYCEKSCLTRNALACHMKTHEECECFPCNLCNRIFYFKNTLEDHQKRYHCNREKPAKAAIKSKHKQLKAETSRGGDFGGVAMENFAHSFEPLSDKQLDENTIIGATSASDQQAVYLDKDTFEPIFESVEDSTAITVPVSGYWNCPHCRKSCQTKSALATHMKTHQGCEVFSCNLCDRHFYFEDTLLSHQRKAHSIHKSVEWHKKETEVYFNEKDPGMINSKHSEVNELIQEARIKFNQNSVNEDDAQAAYEEAMSARLIKEKVTESKSNHSFVCIICKETFCSALKYYKHKRSSECGMDLLCPEPGCGRKFNRRYNLRRHMQIHVEIKTCPRCGLSGLKADKYVVHFKNCHKLEQNKSTSSNLKQPRKVIRNCPICGWKGLKGKFYYKHLEEYHEIYTSKVKREEANKLKILNNVQDPRVEGKDIARPIQPTDLTQEKAVVGEDSNLVYSLKNSHLKSELQTYVAKKLDFLGSIDVVEKPSKNSRKDLQSDAKLFNCKICNLNFTRKKSYEKHMEFHCELMDFYCSTCKKGFQSTATYVEHKNSHTQQSCDDEASLRNSAREETICEPVKGDETTSDQLIDETSPFDSCLQEEKSIIVNHMSDMMTIHEADMAQIDKGSGHDWYKCNTCGKTILRAVDFILHVSFHKDNGELKEDQYKPSHEFYIMVQRLLKSLVCEVCKMVFCICRALQYYKKTGKLDLYKCDVCHASFMVMWTFVDHMSTHGDKVNLSKLLIEMEDGVGPEKRKHVSKKNTVTVEGTSEESCRQCSICQKVMPIEIHVAHMKVHKIKGELKESEQSNVSNDVNQSPNTEHTCKRCGKVLESRWALLIHKKTHRNFASKSTAMNKLARKEAVAHGSSPAKDSSEGISAISESKVEDKVTTSNSEDKGATSDTEDKVTMPDTADKLAVSGNVDKVAMSGTIDKVAIFDNEAKGVTSSSKHSCDICGKVFNSKRALLIHKNYHNEISSFDCSVCGDHFRRKWTYENHMSLHEINGETEALDSSLLKDSEVIATASKSSIKDCTVAFVMEGLLPDVENPSKNLSAEGEETSEKPEKFKEETAEEKLAIGVDGSADSKDVKESIDRDSVLDESKGESVMGIGNTINKSKVAEDFYCNIKKAYVCAICNEAFTRYKKLLGHQKIHLEPLMYDCDKCQQSFRSKEDYSEHQHIAHAVKSSKLSRHYCPICDKLIGNISNFRRHMKSHGLNKQYFNIPMPVISSQTSNVDEVGHEKKDSLILNNESKDDESCTVDGDQGKDDSGFISELSHLESSISELEVPEGSLHCHLCDHDFSSREEYKQHNIIHPFTCRFCGHTFDRLSKYSTHIIRHSESDMKCKYCWKRFLRKREFDIHMLKVHANEIDDDINDAELPNQEASVDEDRLITNEKVKKRKSETVAEWDVILDGKDAVQNVAGVKVKKKQKVITKETERVSGSSAQARQVAIAIQNVIDKGMTNSKQMHSTMEIDAIDSDLSMETDAIDIELLNEKGRKTLTKTKGKRYYTCPICDKVFKTYRQCREHRSLHLKMLEHRCTLCNLDMSSRGTYIEHMKQHDSLPFSCHVCELKFSEKTSLLEHFKIHKEIVEGRDCSEKDGVLSDESDVRSDIEMIQENSSGALSDDSSNLLKGEGVAKSSLGEPSQGSGDYQCHVCNRKFKILYYLKVHMEVHAVDKPFECQVCHKRLPSMRRLKRHAKLHMLAKRFACKLCSKAYTYRYELRKHLKRSHHLKKESLGEAIIEIMDNESFSDKIKENLDLSIPADDPVSTASKPKESKKRESSIEPPVDRKEKKKAGESQQTAVPFDAYVENTPVTGKKQLKCPLCEKVCSCQSNMNDHIISHSSNKPWKCPDCQVHFKRQWDRNRHIRKKHNSDTKSFLDKYGGSSSGFSTDAKWYQCTACDKRFLHDSVWKIHMMYHTGESTLDYIPCEEESYECTVERNEDDEIIGLESGLEEIVQSAEYLEEERRPYVTGDIGKDYTIEDIGIDIKEEIIDVDDIDEIVTEDFDMFGDMVETDTLCTLEPSNISFETAKPSEIDSISLDRDDICSNDREKVNSQNSNEISSVDEIGDIRTGSEEISKDLSLKLVSLSSNSFEGMSSGKDEIPVTEVSGIETANVSFREEVRSVSTSEDCESSGYNALKSVTVSTEEESSENVMHTELKVKESDIKKRSLKKSKGSSSVKGTSPPKRNVYCSLCNIVYSNSKQLFGHIHIHPGLVFYQCDVCGETLKNGGLYRKHALTHITDYFTCDDNSYVNHESEENVGKKVVCTLCKKGFATKYQLVGHMQIHAKEVIRSCEACGDTFESNKLVYSHLYQHLTLLFKGPSSAKEKNVKENPVSKEYATDGEVEQDLASVDSSQSFGLQKEPEKSSETIGLQKTVEESSHNNELQEESRKSSHNSELQKESEESSQAFGLQDIVEESNHSFRSQGTVESNHSFGMQEAPEESNHSFELQEAPKESNHSFEMQKTSEESNESFGLQEESRESSQSGGSQESREEPSHTFGLDESAVEQDSRNDDNSSPSVDNCEKNMSSQNVEVQKSITKAEKPDPLTDGKMLEEVVKPFSCMYCSKKFLRKDSMRYHMRLHTGEKLYECDVCAKKFIKRSHLEKHAKVHF